jgi:hypothetical protein
MDLFIKDVQPTKGDALAIARATMLVSIIEVVMLSVGIKCCTARELIYSFACIVGSYGLFTGRVLHT